MSADKLTPDDPRVEHKYADLNGQKYHYLLGNPSKPPRATIFLIHGWPDHSFGWRYQIPTLLAAGLRVIAPDMMGYSLSSAPQSLTHYTLKRAASDMAALAAHLSVPRIILLGHDWGGSIVYRIALWQPQLITAVIGVCTPYTRPSKENVDLAAMVATTLPNFAYQLQLASGEVEKHIKTEAEIRQFLNAMYGASGANKETGFRETEGIIFENLLKLRKTLLLSEEELDYYAKCYAVNGLRGTLNWYRTRTLNWKDELELCEDPELKIKQPTMFLLATKDKALPPRMSRGMERNFADLTRREVDASHWALWQKPEECNRIIMDWLEEKVLGGGNSKARI